MKRLFQITFAFAFVSFFVCPGNSQTVQVAKKTDTASATSGVNAVTFTEKERAYALKRFDMTQDLFIKEISGLSDAQLNFKEDATRWSIAEAAEHIVAAEGGVLALITNRVLKTPVPVGKDNYRIKDQVIWMTVTNRNTTFNAPNSIQPKGKFKTTSEIISAFKKARANTTTFIKDTDIDLRNQFGENPVLGMIDGLQWFIFLNGHSQRHIDQIKQIKAHPDFPAK